MPAIALRLKASILPSQARVIWGDTQYTGIGRLAGCRIEDCGRLKSRIGEFQRAFSDCLEAQEVTDALEERPAYFGGRRRRGMRFSVPMSLRGALP